MKEYTVYTCEKCGKEFPRDFKGCTDHEEKEHTEPGTLWGEVTNPVYLGPASYYPDGVDVPMKDGSVMRYIADTLVKGPEQKDSPQKED